MALFYDGAKFRDPFFGIQDVFELFEMPACLFRYRHLGFQAANLTKFLNKTENSSGLGQWALAWNYAGEKGNVLVPKTVWVIGRRDPGR